MSDLPVPLASRILIRPDAKPETTDSGLVVMRDSSDPETVGVVVALGPDCSLVGLGAHVIFPPDCGQVIQWDTDRLIMVHESDLLAVIDEETT